jgi:hypothetical protein
MEPTILAPGVYQYDLPEKLAKNIVEMTLQLSNDEWKQSTLSHAEDLVQEIRTSQSLNFGERLPFWNDEVRRHSVPAIIDYAGTHLEPVPHHDEGFTLLRYKESNKYDFHADASWNTYRTISCIIYLNPSEYEGGETYFKHFDIKVKPEKPAIVVFPSNYAYLHAAMPVTSGEKFVLVTWMSDLPPGLNPGSFYDICRVMGKV